ncbi:MAG: insulinase family protein [Ignavibacteria bacterium]|nr:insulinase family protein [Ignavibacteria bacterium]
MSFYEKTCLDNGIIVLSEKSESFRSFSFGVWINVGSRNENKHNNGISHFIEHCVFKGTKSRNTRQIALSLESIGGYLNAFTTKEQTCFYARALSEHLEKSFDVVADLVTSATFKDEEIEKEQRVVREELISFEDNPEELIPEILDRELFSPHPLCLPIIGTKENLESFTRNDLLDFTNKNYLPKNIIVAVAGNIQHEEIVRLAEKYFGGLKQINSSVAKHGLNARLNPKTITIQKPINQVHICMGLRTFGLQDKRKTILSALNVLVGDGASSRLFLNVREKFGLVYNIYSFVNNYYESSTFGIYACTSVKHKQRTVDLIWKELNKIKEGKISKSEFLRVKEHLKGSLLLGLESTSSKMMRLATSEFYYGKVNSIENILNEIDSIQIEDLQKLAKDLFREEKFTLVSIEPEGTRFID